MLRNSRRFHSVVKLMQQPTLPNIESASTELYSSFWEQRWQAQQTPWDASNSSPIFLQFLQHEAKQLFVKNTSQYKQFYGLVPGCGSGWDVFNMANYFGALLRETSSQQSIKTKFVGLDISETALLHVRQDLLPQRVPEKEFQQLCHFEGADFFQYEFEPKYDLIFDYTFFCALHPELRAKWAQTMSQLLSKEREGILATIIYPLKKQQDAHTGPPFIVSLAEYQKVLLPLGFELISVKDTHELTSHPARQGNEMFALWKLKKN